MDFDITNQGERRERIKLLTERARLYEQLRKKSGLKSHQANQLLEDLRELERLKRVDRCENNVLLFMYEYFSDDLNPDNDQNLIPAGTSIADAPEFHRELCQILNEVSNINPTARICWGAPRGHAKSAYLSNCFPIHQIVYNKRKYILIISETDSASKKFIEWVSLQLKFNAKLREDFGEFLESKKALNERDNQEAFLTKNGILVQASSMGKQLRGARNGSYRPDLVILDDLESAKNTNTPELRMKNLDWFNKVIIPIGDPSRTAIVYMGTVVHISGLLPEIIKRADFQSKKFAAIVNPPEREDLWDEFERILRDQDNPDRRDDAFNLYHDNFDEMNKGVKVLWGGRFNYCKLMEEKVNMGSKAFNSEFMNNPIDEDNQMFKPSLFTFFDYGDLDGKRFDYYGAWDIALGKNNRSDYNAIIIIARDKKTGVLYVVDAWAKKCPGHEALNVVVEKIRKYSPKIFAVETVAAQFDFYRQLRDRLPKERLYSSKLKPIISKTRKEERIESMEPLFENGIVRLMRHQRLLIEQLEQFPNGENDDLPDALQMACDLCQKSSRRTYTNKPKGL